MQIDFAQAYETLMQFLYRAPIGLAEADLDGAIEMINPMAAQLLMPLSRDGSLDNLFATLAVAAPQLRQLSADCAQPSGVVCESIRIPLAGPPGAQDQGRVLSLSLFKLESRRLMAVLGDATLEVQREQQALVRKLDAAAHTDSLTRMPNRTAVRELIQRALDRPPGDAGHDFAVLFMNCDRFKQINDTLGRAAGDDLLGQVADRLRASLRRRDPVGRGADVEPIAARVAGDEFVVVLEHLQQPDDVHAIAQRLLDVLATPYRIGRHEAHCSISMGIVLRGQAAGDADSVLQDASIAMAEAKRAGGARYVMFAAPLRERAVSRGGIEADLRRALDQRQLFVVYQPVVGLQEAHGIDRCAGVEALVRWRHPERGVVPPLEFIGVAEECGLIDAIGEFVLDTACRQFVRWRGELGARAPRSLAVNLSRAQLGGAGLVAAVRSAIEASGIAPACLQLEVTESLAAQDEAVQARLHELKALRLTLALDDFGTGYSSLASLHLLPVDTVKIDRSFVSEADTSHRRRVLIEATLHVAASLGMSTVAEGIETAAQAEVIRALGCDKGQGYHFSRPLPAQELARWLQVGEVAASCR